VEALIGKHHLQDSHSATGHIDGDYVIKKLGIKGPGIKFVLENSAIWRLLNQDKSAEDFEKVLHQNLKQFQDADYLRATNKNVLEESGFAW
jgi:hypothetical protein